MSNLGYYQTLTTIMKKVGGPIAFVVEVAGTGGIICSAITLGVVTCINKRKNRCEITDNKMVFRVKKIGVDNKAKTFNIGDSFRVLEQDKDAVFIEIIGDKNNPYFESEDFLRTISDYKRRKG